MSLLKNSTIVVAGVIISNLLAYIFHFVAGRMLGPADYGVFGALMALFLIVALPAGALGSAITKFTSKYIAEKKIGKIEILRKRVQRDVLIFAGVMFLIILLFSRVIADYLNISSNVPVIFVGFTLIFALILPVNRGILQGMKKFKIYGGNLILESGSRLILVVALLFIGMGVDGAILAYGLAYFVAFLFIFSHIGEIKEGRQDNKKLDMKNIYKFILLVLFVNLIMQLIINVPSIFIKHYLSAEFTGLWTAALNIARISLFVTGAIATVMFPEIAGEKDHSKKKKIFGRAVILTLLASVGCALIFFLFPGLLISVLYGSAYLGAVPILQWMGVAMIFIGLLQLWMNYWLAKK